jgi:hypothetical protein
MPIAHHKMAEPIRQVSLLNVPAVFDQAEEIFEMESNRLIICMWFQIGACVSSTPYHI